MAMPVPSGIPCRTTVTVRVAGPLVRALTVTVTWPLAGPGAWRTCPLKLTGAVLGGVVVAGWLAA
jgi:hypothetical protein